MAKTLNDIKYQNQEGIVHSKRQSTPRVMKETKWKTPLNEKSSEKHLEHLINSGHPWRVLRERLKALYEQLLTITDEYSRADDSINKLTSEVRYISDKVDKIITNKQSNFLTNIGVVFVFFDKVRPCQRKGLI